MLQGHVTLVRIKTKQTDKCEVKMRIRCSKSGKSYLQAEAF